jgi:toxin ParE1/3/4
MRRLEVVWRPDALLDLEDIYSFVFKASRSHATSEKFVRRIMARADRVGDAPLGGRPRDDLSPGLRTVPFDTVAVIAYRVGETIEIVGVFYGGRDYEALYRGYGGEK